MDKFLTDNPTTKRLVLGLVTGAGVAFAQQHGVSEDVCMAILGLAGVMITGSNIKEAHIEGKKAAAGVVTVDDAVKVLAATEVQK